MKGEPVYVVDAIRTPFGRYAGALATVRPDDLLATVLREVVARNQLPPDRIDEVIAGCVCQAGEDSRNVARMAALLSGLPETTPGVTINRLCASGLSALTYGARAIAAGEANLVIAAGVESMSRAPYVMAKSSRPFQFGAPEVVDSALGWRFVNSALAQMYPPIAMGETAENVSDRYSISREDQDRFALESHERALRAWETGFFVDHVVPVTVGKYSVALDEGPRADTSLEKLAKLSPAFREGGTVTAGNSSTLNDGAGAAVLASESACLEFGLEPQCRIVATGQAGVDPSYMGIGPVPATRVALERAGWNVGHLDIVEINEAFASQVLAVIRELDLDQASVNRQGGAISIGHPLGASGIRLAASIVQQMRDAGDLRRALATACIGVGQGESILFERV
jgi:acetyl-CoA acetyltransferase family protein